MRRPTYRLAIMSVPGFLLRVVLTSFLTLVSGALFSAYWLYFDAHRILSQAERTPHGVPKELRSDSLTNDEYEELLKDLSATKEKARLGETVEFRLKSSHLGAVFLRDPKYCSFEKGTYLLPSVKDGKLHLQFSIPLPFAPYRGRFFYGHATMTLQLNAGVWKIYLDDLQLPREQLPDFMRSLIRQVNLAPYIGAFLGGPTFQAHGQVTLKEDTALISYSADPNEKRTP